MIRFEDVSYAYEKSNPILKGINLVIPSGLTLLVGLNGCGKSTFLKMAAGVEKPDSGRVFIQSLDLWEDEIGARRNLTYLPEQPDLTPYASIREIINLVCRLRGESLEKGSEALDFFGLKEISEKTVRELSMGQRRRAVFAACLVGNPDTILLDEPLEGMDLGIQKKILEWIGRRTEIGANIILVSHAVAPFLNMASTAMTLHKGQAHLYEALPDLEDEKRRFLKNLAEGMLPK